MTEERLVKVKLIGEMGRRFGREYEFMARNAKDIFSALTHQIEGFSEYMYTAHENNMGFKVISDDPQGMTYEGMMLSCDRLIIAPVIAGSGGGTGRILLGAALIGMMFIPGVNAFAAVKAGTGILGSSMAFTTMGSLMFGLGASLILGGISQLLAPQVETPDGDSNKKESFMFDRAAELTTQGYPMPLIYGRFLCQAPLVISSAIETVPA